MSDDLPNPANYHGNSNKDKAKKLAEEAETDSGEKKQLEPVAKGIKRKKSVGRRFVEAFTGEDIQSVGQYVFWDVLIPAAKSAILDAVSTGIERAMYGDNRPRSSSRRPGYTSYDRMSKPTTTRYETSWKRPEREISQRARASHNFDEIILETRGEAEEVLEKLTNLIDRFDIASVSELYQLVGISGNYTDDKWGWATAAGMTYRRISQGYLLDLPQPELLR